MESTPWLPSRPLTGRLFRLAVLLAVVGVQFAFRTSHELAPPPPNGVLEVVEIVHFDRDPFWDFRRYEAQWWIDEYAYQIEALRREIHETPKGYKERDDQIKARIEKTNELERDMKRLDALAKEGMTLVRGWDGANEREVAFECRQAESRLAQRLKPGDFAEYIYAEHREHWKEPILTPHPYGATEKSFRVRSLKQIRRPADLSGNTPTHFSWSTVNADPDDYTAKLVEMRNHNSHPFSVLEVRSKRGSVLQPRLISATVHVDAVDSAGVRTRLTTDGPLTLRGSSLGSSIGWGNNLPQDLGQVVRMPYPAPPEGATYEFEIVEVVVASKPNK